MCANAHAMALVLGKVLKEPPFCKCKKKHIVYTKDKQTAFKTSEEYAPFLLQITWCGSHAYSQAPLPKIKSAEPHPNSCRTTMSTDTKFSE